MHSYSLHMCNAYTLEGAGITGARKEKMSVDKRMLQPKVLRGLSPKIDEASALAVLAVEEHREGLKNIDNRRTGILIGTRLGNHQMAKVYSDKIRRDAASPSAYSVSGYNMCAALPALAYKYQGPSLVLPGDSIDFFDLMVLGTNYIRRDDADAMMIGQVEISKDGEWGLGIFMSIIREGMLDTGYRLNTNAGVFEGQKNEVPDHAVINEISRRSNYMKSAVAPFLFMNDKTYSPSDRLCLKTGKELGNIDMRKVK